MKHAQQNEITENKLERYLSETTAQLQLKKNLYFFKKNNPLWFNKFSKYTPNTAYFSIDASLNKNIKYNGKWLINNHDEFNQRIDKFIMSPRPLHFSLSQTTWQKNNCLHQFHLERLKKLYYDTYSENLNDTSSEQKPILLMLFFGLGLGDQITKIIAKTEIYNIFIYEPSDDIFFASMHTLDYEPLFQQFNHAGKSIHFHIGDSSERAVHNFIQKIRLQLDFAALETYFFDYYLNDKTLEFYNSFSKTFNKVYYGLGFAEDEIIGFVHTLEKFKYGSQYLNKAIHSSEIPAIIVGAGSSIDKNINTIKEIQNNTIIISCSSSLEVLYKHGIQPDFHVEMERTKPVVDKIKMFPDKDFLKKIHFVGLNTVHPESMGYFASEHFILKKIDTAADILSLSECNDINTVTLTHPTSGNTATTLAIHLGFKKIYLFGLDLGMHSSSEHHSKDSIYFLSDPVWAIDKIESDLLLKGNFCEKVQSTYLLETAKNALEQLLFDNSDVQCLNASDGAFIVGSTPTQAHEIAKQIPPITINKEIVVLNILNTNLAQFQQFEYAQKIEDNWRRIIEAIEKSFSLLLSSLDTEINTKKQLIEALLEQHKNAILLFHAAPLLSTLLSGSFIQLQNLTSALLLNLQDGMAFNRTVKKMYCVWTDYFNDTLYLCKNMISTESESFDFKQFIQKYPESSLQDLH